jgi:Predicted phosphohydrolases
MKRVLFLCNLLLFLSFIPDKAQVPYNQKQTEFSFAFMTDIHLEPEYHAVEGFKQAIDTINKLNPEFVITGGDNLFDINSTSYSRADSLITLYNKTKSRLKMPVYTAMGNHDLFGTFIPELSSSNPMYGKKMFESKIGKRYQTFVYKGWKFFILDDIDETVKKKYKGYVDSTEMDWIQKELAATNPKTPIIIVLHIPLITTFSMLEQGALFANPEGLAVTNSKQVLDLFQGYNLKLVLQGHLHVYEDLYVRNIRFITGGAISGWKWHGPNKGTREGFVLVKVKGDSFDYKYIDYGWKARLN